MTADIRIADLFPSRWLKAKDLTDANANRIIDTVTRATLEEVQPQPGEKIQRLALHLREHKPYLVTSKADATTLAERYQVATASQLVGRQVAIKLDVWRGKAVLRLAPPPPAAKPKPASTPPPATTPSGAQAATPPPVATAAPQPATTPPLGPKPEKPVATAATELKASFYPSAGEGTPDTPPVAPPPPAGNGDNGAGSAVEVWPPREQPWVARNKSGDIHWATTFWQLAALLNMNADDARRILKGHGDDLEAATAALWESRPR